MRFFGVEACALAFLLMLAACTRWEPYAIPVAPASGLPSSLRVWGSDQASTVLAQPFVRHDTLYGRSRGDTVGLDLREIARLERPRLDLTRTVGATIGGLATWIALGLLGGGWE